MFGIVFVKKDRIQCAKKKHLFLNSNAVFSPTETTPGPFGRMDAPGFTVRTRTPSGRHVRMHRILVGVPFPALEPVRRHRGESLRSVVGWSHFQ